VLWGESRWGVVRAEGADFCEKNGKKGEETRIMCEKLPPSAKTALIFASTLTIFLLDPLLGDTIAIVGSIKEDDQIWSEKEHQGRAFA